MQKLSSYLYPNYITAVTGLDIQSLRWKTVYQNNIKLYKGVDNVLTVDFKNADQKRIDINGFNLEMSVLDINGYQVVVAPIEISEIKGLGTVTISESALAHLDPQFLAYTIYKINQDQTKTVFYTDSNFGAVGKIELFDSIQGRSEHTRYITSFKPISKELAVPFEVSYYSDAVELTQVNFLKPASEESVSFEFINRGLSAKITVQFTNAAVISANINWIDVDTFTIDHNTESMTKFYEYPVYNRELTWARIVYERDGDNTGSLDRVIVRI